MKVKNEISIKDFGSVDRDKSYLLVISNLEMELMEGSFLEIIEYFREMYCDEDLSLGVDEILEVVDGVIEDIYDDIRIFIK
jgi:hypothetical protein